MTPIWMSLLLALAIAVPASAQETGSDNPALKYTDPDATPEYDAEFDDSLLDDPLLNDPDLGAPILDESTLDDPLRNVPQQDPAVSEPSLRIEDLPTYQRVPKDVVLTPEQIFEIMDTDKNGVIDKSEWRQQSMVVFYVRDIDEDTNLSREEAPGLTDEVFKKMDLNGDGILSGYEYNQSAFNKFEAADTDKDGVITLDEFRAFIRKIIDPAASSEAS